MVKVGRVNHVGLLSQCLFLITFLINFATSTNREHKVHNIVLYPDKHSWCRRTAIKQVVSDEQCESVEVDNSVCVGGCFSYSIPKTEPQSPGDVRPYCDSCQPSQTSWTQVMLKCGENENRTKRVEIIEDCSCSTCPGMTNIDDNDNDSNKNSPDVPQLLNLLKHRSNSSSNQQHNIDLADSDTTHRLGNLLKILSAGDDELDNIDKHTINDLISEIKSRDSDSDDENSIDSPIHDRSEHNQIRVDIKKLRHLLGKGHVTESSLNTEKLLQNDDESEKDDDDDNVENVSINTLNRDTNHFHENNHHTNHEENHHTNHEGNHHLNHEHHTVHAGRHVKGPHHSQILMDDDTTYHRPTLDVESHHLRPAVAGSEITYRGHHTHSLNNPENFDNDNNQDEIIPDNESSD